MHGEVDHSSMYGTGVQDYWYSNTDIRRSIFMGDYIYAISSAGMTVHDTENLSHIITVNLPEDEAQIYYYSDEESEDSAGSEPVETQSSES